MQMKASSRKTRGSSPLSSLVAYPAGFLDELVDQGLTDPSRDVLVNRVHRLAHRHVLIRGQRDDFGLAGLLDRLKRLVVFLRRLAVAEFGGFLHRLVELAANVGGKTVPELLVHDHD